MKTRKNYGEVNTTIVTNGVTAKLETWNMKKGCPIDFEWLDSLNFDMDQPMTLKMGENWVHNWNLYLKYFSIDTIRKCLAEMKARKFLTLKWVPADYWSLKYSAEHHNIFSRVANKDRGIIKKDGIFVHDIVRGYNFYAPDEYDFGGEKLFKKCLLEEYKYLKHYDFSSHHLSDPCEIYVHTSFNMTDEGRAVGTNSIYVPMDALLYGDSSIIVKRQTEYFSDYYHWEKGRWCSGVTEEEVNSWREKHIGFLDSVIGKSLLEEVNEFRK